MSATHNRNIRIRIVLIGLVFSIFLAVIGVKAVYLQVVQSGWLSKRAASEYRRNIAVDGNRGAIYDAKGNELAISGEAVSIVADPSAITAPDAAAAALAGALDLEESFVADRISDPGRSFAWIKRRVSPKKKPA